MADTGITLDSLRAQLAAVQSAITAMLTTGKSIVRPGLSYTRVEMRDATKLRQELVRQIQRSESGAVSVSEVGPGNNQGYDNDASWSHG